MPSNDGKDELVHLRRDYLDKQLAAVQARIVMLVGQKFTFDEEAERLYDAKPPTMTEAEFQPVLDELERLLPGRGPLIDRYAAFRQKYVIPTEKLDAVFRAAIDGCRSNTLEHLTLPAGETFTVEYVTGKSWSAYNWYKGNFTSVIQVNTDLPITIDRALDLACHEGYPGHHVYNVAARTHARARAQVGRVLRVSAVLAAVADRRRHRQLRDRGRVSWRGADAVRARHAVSDSRASIPDRGSLHTVLRPIERLSLRRQRSRASVPERRRSTVTPRRPGCRPGRSRRDDRAEQRVAILRPVSELRHQLEGRKQRASRLQPDFPRP